MLSKVICFVLIGGLFSNTVFLGMSSASGSNGSNIFLPGSKPFGLSYSDHIMNYWKWLLFIDKNINPVNDQKGDKCAIGQLDVNSSVFYLVSTPGGKSFSTAERVCKIPHERGLFIPVTQVEISYNESPGSKSDQDLINEAKADQDGVTSMSLNIDGIEYEFADLNKFRTQTPAFDVVFGSDPSFGQKAGPLYGVEAGPSRTAADGRYIITEPLTQGNHTIRFNNSYDPMRTILAQDVTYKIIVE